MARPIIDEIFEIDKIISWNFMFSVSFQGITSILEQINPAKREQITFENQWIICLILLKHNTITTHTNVKLKCPCRSPKKVL